MPKRPIDAIRDSAGAMAVGRGEEPSPIADFSVIDGRLHVVKERSIYQITMADAIDPKRTDPSVPNTQQRVLSYGSKDSIVSQTLLTAEALTRGRLLADDVPTDQIVSLSYRALTHLAAMADRARVVSDQINAINVTWQRTVEPGMSVPSVKELDSHVRGSITDANHVFQQLLMVGRLLFGSDAGKKWFQSLTEILERQFGNDDPLAAVLRRQLPAIQFVRAARNCVEHPRENQRLVVSNYKVLPLPVRLKAPTVEVLHPDFPNPEADIVDFQAQLLRYASDCFEHLLAGLLSKRIKSFGHVQFVLRFTPRDGVRYSFDLLGPPLPEDPPTP